MTFFNWQGKGGREGRYGRVRKGERGGVVVFINPVFPGCLARNKYLIIIYGMNR